MSKGGASHLQFVNSESKDTKKDKGTLSSRDLHSSSSSSSSSSCSKSKSLDDISKVRHDHIPLANPMFSLSLDTRTKWDGTFEGKVKSFLLVDIPSNGNVIPSIPTTLPNGIPVQYVEIPTSITIVAQPGAPGFYFLTTSTITIDQGIITTTELAFATLTSDKTAVLKSTTIPSENAAFDPVISDVDPSARNVKPRGPVYTTWFGEWQMIALKVPDGKVTKFARQGSQIFVGGVYWGNFRISKTAPVTTGTQFLPIF